MFDWGGFVYDSVESVVFIGGIVNGSDGTIGFDDGILSFYNISITGFVLAFNVSSMVIVDTILVSVFRVGLKLKKSLFVVMFIMQ